MKGLGHYIDALAFRLRQYAAERKDFRTTKRFVIFESDDWGSIRVPSKMTHDSLVDMGYELDSRPYEHLDGLERDCDVKALSDVLLQVKDFKGNNPVFTLNYLSGNPDFEKIRINKFKKYYWEPIDTTYKKYEGSSRVVDIVRTGIKNGIFEVEFHGREHFDVLSWLRALQIGDIDVCVAFEHNMCGIFPKGNASAGNKYMLALNADIETLQDVIGEGINEFYRIWHRKPLSFIAPCYMWSPLIEPLLRDAGIRIIQGSRFQRNPMDGKSIVHFMGQRNSLGQIYTVRNCAFEPATQLPKEDPVLHTMNYIRKAFEAGTPAVISTHRINYTSRLSKDNAERSCELLNKLLIRLLSEFPDVEFTTGVELFEK